jgi:hypothetical protein
MPYPGSSALMAVPLEQALQKLDAVWDQLYNFEVCVSPVQECVLKKVFSGLTLALTLAQFLFTKQ